tara:strand:+ start:75 stop:1373 length:1299 start_codon:yes stop_codon:yes gene_type:complete
MGSTFSTFSGQKVKGFAGKEYSVPIFLQFVPGYCAEVVHSTESLGYKGNQTINSIYAVSHVTSKVGKRRQQSFSEDNRYFPLLRNHGDVPTKGDPVLLCTIGKINYYLGPLNTINNSPTWNPDLNFKKELVVDENNQTTNTPRGERGESLNFNKEEDAIHDRLEKYRNKDLDYGPIINEVTGDYIIEGRHGNSVRVGSRSNNPYIFISNERGNKNYSETLADGSLITITSNGTLAQHFPSYIRGDIEDETSTEVFGFTLGSDSILPDNVNRLMKQLVSSVNNNQDAAVIVDGYSGNQVLFHSDRITINTKLDDIYLSSIKDVHIGTGRHLTISTNEDLIIESERTFLGNPTPNGSSREMQSMVLGEPLQNVLNSMLDLISKIEINTSLGPQTPTMSAGSVGEGGVTLQATVSNLKNEIINITSNKHFIEPNT